MLLLIHQDSENVIELRYKNVPVEINNSGLCQAIWNIAEEYPDELLFWCEKDFIEVVDFEAIERIFSHDLIMASFSIENNFFSEDIGYIDQLPFINISRHVQYATWRMSTDAGGIKASVLLQFKKEYEQVKDFGFLLNSIAKLGQQNGLFCYSTPHLVKPTLKEKITNNRVEVVGDVQQLFSFVQAHYKNFRLWLLFWCFVRYKKVIPVKALFIALFQKKRIGRNLNLGKIKNSSGKNEQFSDSIDVIIPTLGRKKYLLQVLDDLKNQTILPVNVIIVEQNSTAGSTSEIPELESQVWPFKLVHHFIHKTGACRARNLALKEVKSEWVFFADDDIRFEADLLERSFDELKYLGAECLNINCKQEGEETVFPKIKQWGSFGSGTSIVNSKYLRDLYFDEAFEYGFGEDKDYGMQLRNVGCDIIYHPELEILHLKAPRGGFREVTLSPWEVDQPKPSPTLMIFAQKYYTLQQFQGFKTELFLKYFFKQKIKNPIKYLRYMEESWRSSKKWAEKLRSRSVVKKITTSE